jgi:AcrR family transcriptional regulator
MRVALSRGDRRRAAIIKAATAVFLKHGFEGTSLDEIIRRSGGSRSTLYEEFGDKEGLFAAIIGNIRETILLPLRGALEAYRPIDEVLTAFAERFMAQIMTPASLAFYRMVIAESRRFPRLGRHVFAAGPDVAAEQLAQYLRAESRAGTVRVAQPALAARIFLEMIKGDLHTRALFAAGPLPSRSEIRACISTAVGTFLDGIRAKQKRRRKIRRR